jgi:hypothetical protein
VKPFWLLGIGCLLLLPVARAQQMTAAVPSAETLWTQECPVSVTEKKEKSPKTAALCSIIPGGGQIYNGKYWKVPIVYGVIGGAGYWLYSNHEKYLYYRDEYRLRLNGATEGLNPELANMSTENVAFNEKHYQRNQELGVFVFLICYGLNIVDAMVDAHFSTYDVSDNLTLGVRPCLAEPLPYAAVRTPACGTAPALGMRMFLKF